jgi:hypothetical protein
LYVEGLTSFWEEDGSKTLRCLDTPSSSLIDPMTARFLRAR